MRRLNKTAQEAEGAGAVEVFGYFQEWSASAPSWACRGMTDDEQLNPEYSMSISLLSCARCLQTDSRNGNQHGQSQIHLTQHSQHPNLFLLPGGRYPLGQFGGFCRVNPRVQLFQLLSLGCRYVHRWEKETFGCGPLPERY
jgi:hypothetical protein